MLESDNTFRLYYSFKNVDPTKLAYAIGGKPAELKQRTDGAYYLALDAGVYRTHVINGTTHHALLLELLTDAGIGTVIHRTQEAYEYENHPLGSVASKLIENLEKRD